MDKTNKNIACGAGWGTGDGWDWDNGGKIYFLHGNIRR